MTFSSSSSSTPASSSALEDAGYHKTLSSRQIQMIALGGAIGTGLFLGTGSRLSIAGPGLFLIYGLCGGFVFLILRALGELVIYRPSSGSFVSYAREFLGEKSAFIAGWLYCLNWSMTTIVDTTAIAKYFHYWSWCTQIPQWVLALSALILVLCINLTSAKVFGEFEFWASLIKVSAIVIFLVVGMTVIVTHHRIGSITPGIELWSHHGGLFPHGILPLILVISGVIFSYSGVELIGTAAGETRQPHQVIPQAINTIIARIAIFYVGSLAILALCLPYTSYQSQESPFVTFFSHIGFHGAGTLMNLVVLTAAFSSLNAGLYSTGRILRSMALAGSGPRFTQAISPRGIPYGGILLTSTVGLGGVLLNAFKPHQAFDIVLNVAALGVLTAWATIVICQLRLYYRAQSGDYDRPRFRMPLSPYSGYATLVFLAGVLILMLCDQENGRILQSAMVILPLALTLGWYRVRRRANLSIF